MIKRQIEITTVIWRIPLQNKKNLSFSLQMRHI